MPVQSIFMTVECDSAVSTVPATVDVQRHESLASSKTGKSGDVGRGDVGRSVGAGDTGGFGLGATARLVERAAARIKLVRLIVAVVSYM